MNLDCCEASKIKKEALRLGFSACGIASADNANEHIHYFRDWIAAGHHAGMTYLENCFEKRCYPQLLVKGVRSIVSVALNYYPERLLGEEQYQFAYYAYGKDYHQVMRRKLNDLFSFIHNEVHPVQGKAFCDTAPILERYWAWRAGLGWIGKNTQLIIPKAGSYFFLGEHFLDRELEYDAPFLKDNCGSCACCLNTCPSKALEQPYKLNARRCLSYLTIENREAIPEDTALGNRIYGCDECQKACPWNHFAVPCNTQEFQPVPAFLEMQKEDWRELTEEQYGILFKGSAVNRAKYKGLKRNIELVGI
jgi:epoxyqueuosine reductase